MSVNQPVKSKHKGSPLAAALKAGGYWLPLLFALLIVLILFLPICNFAFSIIDDANNIFANRFICHLSDQNIGYLWRHPYYELYMPVTDTIWAFLARIAPLKVPISVLPGGEPTNINPAVFHTASLIFHLATTAIVFGILKRLRFVPWGCCAGALVFSAHPMQVESVAWITGMNNLTCGFFGFLAVYLYLLAIPEEGSGGRGNGRRKLFLSFATLVFAVALLSKPIATIVPLIVVVLEVVLLKRPIRLWFTPVAIWFSMSFVCIVVTQLSSGSDSSGVYSPIWGRPFIAGDALAFYFAKLIYPADITFDYMRNPHTVLHHWWGYCTWLAPAAICCRLCLDWPFSRRKQDGIPQAVSPVRRSVEAGVLIFIAGVLPTIGLVPYYSESISTVSDRFVYLAMLGPAIAAAALFSMPVPVRKALAVLPIALLAIFIYRASLAVPVWNNMYSLTNEMLDSSPGSPMSHQSYGIILCQAGQWDNALAQFKKAERLNSGVNSATEDSIGLCLYHLKRYDEAITHYQQSIRVQPDDNDAWFQLWLVWSQLGRLSQAEAYIRARIAKYPDDDRAKFTLGLVLMQENRPADALPYVELAAKSEPDSSENQYYVGVIFQKLGRFADAAAYYKKALDLDPRNADAAKALSSLPAQR